MSVFKKVSICFIIAAWLIVVPVVVQADTNGNNTRLSINIENEQGKLIPWLWLHLMRLNDFNQIDSDHEHSSGVANFQNLNPDWEYYIMADVTGPQLITEKAISGATAKIVYISETFKLEAGKKNIIHLKINSSNYIVIENYSSVMPNYLTITAADNPKYLAMVDVSGESDEDRYFFILPMNKRYTVMSSRDANILHDSFIWHDIYAVPGLTIVD